MAILCCLVTRFIPSLIYATVTYLQEEEINFSHPAKSFVSEINKYQDQLYTLSYRENIWKMSEFHLGLYFTTLIILLKYVP